MPSIDTASSSIAAVRPSVSAEGRNLMSDTPVITKNLLAACRNGMGYEAIGRAGTQLRLAKDDQAIAGTQRVEFGRLAVQADQRAVRGEDAELAPAYPNHVQAVRQNFFDAACQAAFGAKFVGLRGRRRRHSSDRTGSLRLGDGTGYGYGCDRCYLLARLTGADRRRGDENTCRAEGRGQVQTKPLEPARHVFPTTYADADGRIDIGARETILPAARISSPALKPARTTRVHGIASPSAATTSPGAVISKPKSCTTATTSSRPSVIARLAPS